MTDEITIIVKYDGKEFTTNYKMSLGILPPGEKYHMFDDMSKQALDRVMGPVKIKSNMFEFFAKLGK